MAVLEEQEYIGRRGYYKGSSSFVCPTYDAWSRFPQLQAPPPVPATSVPAAVPEVTSGEIADVVQCAAEQSFAELGLGSATPVGLIQNLLEFMHVDLGLPWWGAIATCKCTS